MRSYVQIYCYAFVIIVISSCYYYSNKAKKVYTYLHKVYQKLYQKCRAYVKSLHKMIIIYYLFQIHLMYNFVTGVLLLLSLLLLLLLLFLIVWVVVCEWMLRCCPILNIIYVQKKKIFFSVYIRVFLNYYINVNMCVFVYFILNITQGCNIGKLECFETTRTV